MQGLARDVAEVAELREDMTQVEAAAIMARACATQAEGTTREKAALLATIHGEAAEATQRVSTLGDELVIVHRARDVAEEKVSTLTVKAATIDRRPEVAKEQCEGLVHQLILLRIRGSELCITITGAPLLTPLHEGMRFAVAWHNKETTRLAAIRILSILSAGLCRGDASG
jgi:hypothetical protein